LAGLKFFPRDNRIALGELIAALAQSAKTDAHAEEIIDGWLHDSAEVPTPANLYEIAATTTPVSTEPPCPMCEGTGFVACEVVSRIGSARGVKLCECRKKAAVA
jgi:hypothetical protein